MRETKKRKRKEENGRKRRDERKGKEIKKGPYGG